jgi:hypothetical protein
MSSRIHDQTRWSGLTGPISFAAISVFARILREAAMHCRYPHDSHRSGGCWFPVPTAPSDVSLPGLHDAYHFTIW